MPGSAASDLNLHCLPMSTKNDARLIWVYTKSHCLILGLKNYFTRQNSSKKYKHNNLKAYKIILIYQSIYLTHRKTLDNGSYNSINYH